MRKIYKSPFEIRTMEELVKEANELVEQSVGWLTEEEEIEDDAEGGYFQQDDND